MGRAEGWTRRLAWLSLAAGGLGLCLGRRSAPVWVGLAAVTALEPLRRAWRGARGTALRPAIAWAVLAIFLDLGSQVAALRDALPGRPVVAHLTYLCALASLAALISVLNARTPGGGVWAFLMALLVIVFLIPWLEGAGPDHLRLHFPWNVFYAVLAIAGLTNFAPTRYGPAAACLALGFAVELAALSGPRAHPIPTRDLWSVHPWALALSIWVAEARSGSPRQAATKLECVWFWFRDHWGVVWALRVQDRFNQAAERGAWPFRLGWFGLVERPDGDLRKDQALAAGEATLVTLLRRFATPARIEELVTAEIGRPCQASDGAG